MIAPQYRSALLRFTSFFILSSWYLSPVSDGAPQFNTVETDTYHHAQAEFTPPDDADIDRDSIITSTGTYFRPPTDPTPTSAPRTSTGTRRGGCLGPTATAFTIFGPNTPDTILGRTTSESPVFVWHLPEIDATFPIIFRLLAPDENDIPIPIYESSLTYSAGFMTHQLPPSVATLSTGVEYRWQVIIECNPEYPAQAMLQELSFEVVPDTVELSQALATATTATERAVAYGQAGVWYDAIAQVAQATSLGEQETRSGLLTDLAMSLPPESDQIRQDILEIVAATAP
ncbi:DUF928 domain-containing protein [Leptothoe sp. EHU-05/26/07-4]